MDGGADQVVLALGRADSGREALWRGVGSIGAGVIRCSALFRRGPKGVLRMRPTPKGLSLVVYACSGSGEPKSGISRASSEVVVAYLRHTTNPPLDGVHCRIEAV